MIYELLMFFGMFTPDVVKLEQSDTEKLTLEINQKQMTNMVNGLLEDQKKMDAFNKYFESINTDPEKNVYKLVLRFKK